ncbi:MAG: type I restriction enzyme HsdR N-terminal domain-containing protein [Saprospiraceae bacterium]|nr:type I restriction enzyme HsdR N-terminal domain-containing protein [Saprospiraceae bacterium]
MAVKAPKPITFAEQLKQLADKIEATKEQIGTEEGTKNSFIMPLLQILGYDVFNNSEVVPEFIADVGMRKNEKVDYALYKNGKPVVLIECKKWKEKLDKHGTQLTRYFTFSVAKFGILTNGIRFWFYTDLDKTNIMDNYPFFQFDITDHTEAEAEFVKLFCKDNYDQKKILDLATELVYSREIRTLLHSELKNPTRDFIKYIAEKTYLEKQRGRITDKVMTMYTDLTKKTLPALIDEMFSERLIPKSPLTEDDNNAFEDNKIVTTEEELEAYFIVKAICRQKVEASRIVFRDAQTYFAIILDNNRLKTICRIYLNSSKKFIGVFDANKQEVKIEIQSVDDIFKYTENLFAVLKLYEKK